MCVYAAQVLHCWHVRQGTAQTYPQDTWRAHYVPVTTQVSITLLI